VLLADDIDRIRQVLREVLELDGRFEVVAEASDGREAIRLAARERPDAAVIDVDMPYLDGIEALPAILADSPATRVVVLSSYDSREMAERAMRAGAIAYVEKGSAASRLTETLAGAFLGPDRAGMWDPAASRA
jgi:DNA-binding NarL/FixJ family response regulator